MEGSHNKEPMTASFSSDLGGLAAACLPDNHHSAVLLHQVEDVVAILG